MRQSAPVPTQREITVGPHEMFFSITDRRGIILDGNNVFVQMSQYSREELIGTAHNIVRHPDMPKIVFKTLWDTILAGKVSCAYVKNMAKDGSFYWVFATVLPMGDNFLSIRMKPTTPVKGVVEELYRELVNLERSGSVEVSTKVLLGALSSLGFSDYNAFAASNLSAEMLSRYDGQLEDSKNSQEERIHHESPILDPHHLAKITGSFFKIFTAIKKISTHEKTILEKMIKIGDVSKNIEFAALNTIIEAERLGGEGMALSVVAQHIAAVAAEAKKINSSVSLLASKILEGFNAAQLFIALPALQVEMLSSFAEEKNTHSTSMSEEEFKKNASMLISLINESLEKGKPEIFELGKISKQLSLELEHTSQVLMTLSFIQKAGSIESARLPDGSVFYQLFLTIMNLINDSKVLYVEFSEIINRSIRHNITEAIKECDIVSDTISNLVIK